MDFIDFDTFAKDTSTTQDGVFPQPQPPLSLPITSNLDQFSKKFSSFKNILTVEKPNDQSSSPITNISSTSENDLMEKYAQLSLNLLKQEEQSINKDTNDQQQQEIVVVPHGNHNALSTRLSRVLNDPLSDSHIREIFTNLEDRFDKEPTGYVLDLIEPGITGSMTRKRFKGKIESEIVKNQTVVLKSYSPVLKQLKNIEIKLGKLKELSELTNSRISNNFDVSKSLTLEIDALNNGKKMNGLKKGLLVNFKHKFTLNEYEEFILNQGELNDEFFTVLKRAELINENCSILLGLDNPQLGLKIIAKSNSIINRAMDRIVGYTNKTLGNLYSLNSKSESRSKEILDDFYKQVQGDGEINGQRRSSSVSNDSRPIFMSAHDPIRYVGDLLAYVHSVSVNESETITSIFTMGEDEKDEQKVENEFHTTIHDVTDKILRALSRPIKARVEQIVSTETKLSTIVQIFNLVELYAIMFTKQLGNTGNLTETIQQLIKVCQDRIFMIISNRLATIKTKNSAKLDLNLDLQPPEWIIEFYSDILPMLDQITTETMLNLSQDENDKFLDLIINQPIQIFNDHVHENKLFTDKKDILIIKSNFLDLILSKIIPVTLLTDKVIEINDMITEMTVKITELELVNILNQCNLYDYYNIINMICPFTDDFFDVSIYDPIKENKLYTRDNFIKIDELVQNKRE
ncbi:hypothetical protein G210_1850 [Candida maltosa Xu316]|uniref:Conserved oligomeric Golgi complex subunit 6 n=1 Tax=Candida maltosa (strain Xu316) TaxID=1245528 RepID=M3HSV7_CANMX|nr:hypothetical protein G210_1850 [Candida maltosa Xu316]